MKLSDNLKMMEMCGNCGFIYGSHHGGTSPWPRDYCPGHEKRMDWENGPGTVFKPTGKVKSESGEIIFLDSDFEKIHNMSQLEMARLLRHSNFGHKYFDTTYPYSKVFHDRFNELGGMTKEISEEIGW